MINPTVFIGDVALDEYYAADHWPGVGDKGLARQLPAEIGGSIANAAVVHAGLGHATEFISLLNDSALSVRLLDDLRSNEVGVDHVLIDPAAPDSRNLIFLVGGEHVVLTVDMGSEPMWLPDATMTALRQPGYCYTTLYRARRLRHRSGDTLLDSEHLVADLRNNGRKMVFDLDVAGFGEADLPLLTGADLVIFNEVGFAKSFGHDDISRIAPWIEANGIGRVVRTAAANGAAATDGQEIISVPGYAVPVMDVTGAGDCFGGALVALVAEDRPFAEAMELAVAAASRAVTIHGPRGGRASLADILAFRAERGR